MTERQTVKRPMPRGERIVVFSVGAFILAAIILIALDWKKVRDILVKSNPEMTLVAFLLTVISYFCLSFGYVIVNRVFLIKVGVRELFTVGLVSTALTRSQKLVLLPFSEVQLPIKYPLNQTES